MKIVIITGASSGIGREFAILLDNNPKYHDIDEFWLIARRKELLENLAISLKHNTKCFSIDITKESETAKLENALAIASGDVSVLINCAGYGIMGSFQAQNRNEMLGMIRTNCEALTNITYSILPFMKRNACIIQLASAAAFLPQADFAVYAATKAYVLSFSRALREECKALGISVTAVCPGPVDTPFFEIAEKNAKTLAMKKLTMVSPERVVRYALKDAEKNKALSICSLSMKLFLLSGKLLPHSFILFWAGILKKWENLQEK